MATYIWVTVVLFGLNVLSNAYILGSGKKEEPAEPGVVAVRLVIRAALLIWGLKVVGVL